MKLDKNFVLKIADQNNWSIPYTLFVLSISGRRDVSL